MVLTGARGGVAALLLRRVTSCLMLTWGRGRGCSWAGAGRLTTTTTTSSRRARVQGTCHCLMWSLVTGELLQVAGSRTVKCSVMLW